MEVQGHTGVAENESMVRCDVFYVEDDGYYFVPVYVADTVKPTLPMHAPVKSKAPKLMCDEDFVFSLYPNDLIRVSFPREIALNVKNKKSTLPKRKDVPRETSIFFYYKGLDIASALICGITHDESYEFRTIGKTTSRIEKYEVDVLGRMHPIGKEKRMGYSKKKK